jgi:hypothetical protein
MTRGRVHSRGFTRVHSAQWCAGPAHQAHHGEATGVDLERGYLAGRQVSAGIGLTSIAASNPASRSRSPSRLAALSTNPGDTGR